MMDTFKGYPKDTVYFISYAESPTNICLYFYGGEIGIGFVIDPKEDLIVDANCTFITDEAKQIIKSILNNKRIKTKKDLKDITESIKFSFVGPSHKEIIKIVTNNFNLYHDWKMKVYNVSK